MLNVVMIILGICIVWQLSQINGTLMAMIVSLEDINDDIEDLSKSRRAK